MKKTIALFAVLGFVFAPAALRADPSVISSRAVETASAKKSAGMHHSSTVYITSQTAVGSHLPLVVRRCDGVVTSMSPTVSFSQPQIDQTGQTNIASTLIARDPAITVRMR